ncbi:MAG: TrkH family potassium uptake protein [Phormidesmis sp.]
MTIQLRVISRDVSRFLLIPAGMAVLSLPVCLISREWFAIIPFLGTVVAASLLSFILHSLGKTAKEPSMRQTFMSVALGWGLVAVIGALPIWWTALAMGAQTTPTVFNFTNPLNALFESFSGFTSAGLTMTLQPSQLPTSIQWWRSFMQWVGGVGVIVLAVALLEPTQNQYVLYEAEARETRLRLTVTRTVRRIWSIYIGYTVVSILLFRIFGMTWWEAINHSMSAIATGGFSITDGNMGAYGNAVQLSIILIMICGAISFNAHDQMISRRQLLTLWQDHQHRLLIGLLIVGTVIIGVEHYSFTGQFDWTDSAFQWVSALTTCGFNTQALQPWSSTSKLLLSIAMIFGSAAGSTVGGVKLERIIALWEGLCWRFRRTTLSPRQITLRQINGELLTPDQASRQIEDAMTVALLWIISIVVSVFILIPLVPAEYSLSDIIFESASALGTSGLSVGISSPSLAGGGKWLLIVLMWIGRLEIIPVLMLIYAPWQYLRGRH